MMELSSSVGKLTKVVEDSQQTLTSILTKMFNPADTTPVGFNSSLPRSNANISPSANQCKSPETNLNVSPVANQYVSPASNQNVSLAANQFVSPASNQNVSPVANQYVSPASNQNASPVTNRYVSPASNQNASPTANQYLSPATNQYLSQTTSHNVQAAAEHVMMSPSPVVTTAEPYQEALLPEPDDSPVNTEPAPDITFDHETNATAAVAEHMIVTPNQPFVRTPSTPNRVIPVPVRMPIPSMALSNMELTTIYNGSCSRRNFAVNLVRRLFAASVRRASNVSGKGGKSQLNPPIMQYIRSLTFQFFPLQGFENERKEWASCVVSIDESCRRLVNKPCRQPWQCSVP